MRVIFEIPPVPTEALINGRKAVGAARFRVTVFEPGEAATEGPAIGKPLPLVSEWLRTLKPGQPLRIPVPEDYKGPGLRDAVVPRHLIEALPPDASLWVEWKFFVESK